MTPARLLLFGCAALVLAACASTASRPITPAASAVTTPRASTTPAPCPTCGRIERIDAAPAAGGARPQGAVLGGVVGGVLARPAPAAAAGTKPGTGASKLVRLVVLLDNGRRLILTQPLAAGMKVGARVRVDRSRAVLLR